MRCPKCHAETPSDALVCPGCKLPTPRGRQFKADKRAGKNPKSPKKIKEAKRHQRSKAVNIALGSVIGLIAAGLGVYLYMALMSGATEIDPKAAGEMLVRLRRLPSSEQGLSVDDKMNQEVKKSRDSGQLLKYQGWTMRPVQGDKKKILITFSFVEKDSGEKRAEWVADTTNNSFAPRTGLASSVYAANNERQ